MTERSQSRLKFIREQFWYTFLPHVLVNPTIKTSLLKFESTGTSIPGTTYLQRISWTQCDIGLRYLDLYGVYQWQNQETILWTTLFYTDVCRQTNICTLVQTSYEYRWYYQYMCLMCIFRLDHVQRKVRAYRCDTNVDGVTSTVRLMYIFRLGRVKKDAGCVDDDSRPCACHPSRIQKCFQTGPYL